MKGIEKYFLVGIIIVLLLVGITLLFGDRIVAFASSGWERFKGILGEPGEITYEPTPTQDLYGKDIEVPHTLTSPTSIAHQPHEVACDIANKIYNDFKERGLDGLREIPGKVNCYREWCLIRDGVGTFRLFDTEVEPSWEGIISAAYPGCHVCDTPSDDDLFDEICINNDLKDRKVVDANFCDGDISVGGKLIKFGNNNCANFNDGEWGDHCDGDGNDGWPLDDFCDNDRDRIHWIGENSDGDPSYLVRDRTWHPNTEELDTFFRYIYGIIWLQSDNREDRGYDVLFTMIPHPKLLSDFDIIRTVFNDYVRANRIGFWRQEARMSTNVLVKLPADVMVNSIINLIATEAGIDETEVQITYECDNREACAKTQIKETLEGVECTTIVLVRCPSSPNQFHDEPINFITSEEENGKFLKDKTYNVRIENWFGCYEVGLPLGGHKNCYAYIDRTVSIYDPMMRGDPEAEEFHLMGDVNWDCFIDDTDVDICNDAFMSSPGEPEWNPECDLAEPYDWIDMHDISVIAVNFGDICM